MVHIDDTLVSEDVLAEAFCCDLGACLGACCNSEGESGAPLDDDELAALDEVTALVWDDLTPAARREIADGDGHPYRRDAAGDWVTRVVDGRDCVLATYGSGGTCLCAIERAFREGRFATLTSYRDGREPFMKPISCHLYPIRLKQIGDYTVLNYDRQDAMCGCAQRLGRRTGTKVYQCVADALRRRFGQSYLDQLALVADEMQRAGIGTTN